VSADARLKAHLTSALQRLWKSALIVESGGADLAAYPAGAAEQGLALQRLLSMAKPPMQQQDLHSANLQQQLSESALRLPKLLDSAVSCYWCAHLLVGAVSLLQGWLHT